MTSSSNLELDDEADTCVIDAGDDLIRTEQLDDHDAAREQATTDVAGDAIVVQQIVSPVAEPVIGSSASARLRSRRPSSIRIRARRRTSSTSSQGAAISVLLALAVLALIVASRLL